MIDKQADDSSLVERARNYIASLFSSGEEEAAPEAPKGKVEEMTDRTVNMVNDAVKNPKKVAEDVIDGSIFDTTKGHGIAASIARVLSAWRRKSLVEEAVRQKELDSELPWRSNQSN